MLSGSTIRKLTPGAAQPLPVSIRAVTASAVVPVTIPLSRAVRSKASLTGELPTDADTRRVASARPYEGQNALMRKPAGSNLRPNSWKSGWVDRFRTADRHFPTAKIEPLQGLGIHLARAKFVAKIRTGRYNGPGFGYDLQPAARILQEGVRRHESDRTPAEQRLEDSSNEPHVVIWGAANSRQASQDYSRNIGEWTPNSPSDCDA